MNFKDWFDPGKMKHVLAYKFWCKNGYWPYRELPNMPMVTRKEIKAIEHKMALRYCEMVLTLGAKEPIKEKAPQGEKAPEAVQALKDRYVIDDWWRSAWLKLANKREPNRLESKQEYICKRSAIANRRIAKLLDAFDALPIKEKEG